VNGAGNSAGPGEGIWHYDGKSATRHHPRLEWDAYGVTLIYEGGRLKAHRWSKLVPVGTGGGETLYGLSGTPGWRLGFAGKPPQEFLVHLALPGRYGRWIDKVGLWRAVAVLVLLAGAAIYVAVKTPEWIAPHVPVSWENAMGDAMVGDLGGRLCETPASKAALEKLSRELAGDTPLRQVAIANVPMVNAVTLPGGRILIFKELIEKAQSPDELAGVLAHEIGHVRHRDTVTGLVRQLGLSVVLGGATGNAGSALNSLLAMSYSRDAERAADAYSIAALRRADVSPVPTARFFEKLGGGKGGEQAERAQSWFASHPVSADRKAAFEKALVKGETYKPALSPAEWAALRNACRDDKDVRSVTDFDF